MANLVCWASGLLEIKPTNDTPAGPVIIASGLHARLEADMRTHGEYVAKYDAWYVPGCLDVPTEDREESDVHNDRMIIVIEWSKKLRSTKVKGKAGQPIRSDPETST